MADCQDNTDGDTNPGKYQDKPDRARIDGALPAPRRTSRSMPRSPRRFTHSTSHAFPFQLARNHHIPGTSPLEHILGALALEHLPRRAMPHASALRGGGRVSGPDSGASRESFVRESWECRESVGRVSGEMRKLRDDLRECPGIGDGHPMGDGHLMGHGSWAAGDERRERRAMGDGRWAIGERALSQDQ
jgi:hypothetical protein